MASKKEVLMALSTMDFTEEVQVGETVITPADIKDFVTTSLAQIEARTEKAKEKAAERKAAGDQLRADIKAVLGDTPKTIAQIVEDLDNSEVTSAMVVARLTQLCKLQEVFKADTRVDGRSLKVYSTIPFSTEE